MGVMKRLACFFDGTWDRSDSKNVTNVVKLQRAVPKTDHAGIEQITHYESGIATEYTGRLRFWAGVLSVGLGRRIQSAYRFLCEHYEPGDQIYLFGFSRGAFEARTLADLVYFVGIARRDALKLVPQAWRYYRRHRRAPRRKLHRLRNDAHFPVRIGCVGVWDTVGTLGVPFARRHRESRISELPPIVDVGMHALAIDEPRGPYSPLLWSIEKKAVVPQHQIIEQAWFPGSHTDVGGGGPSSALSDAALLWLAERIGSTTDLVIDFDDLHARIAPDPMGEQCAPTTGLYRLSRLLPYIRLIKQEMRGLHPLRRVVLRGWRTNRLPREQMTVNEVVHDSAIARLDQFVPLRRGEDVQKHRYCPRSLRTAVAATAPANGHNATAEKLL